MGLRVRIAEGFGAHECSVRRGNRFRSVDGWSGSEEAKCKNIRGIHPAICKGGTRFSAQDAGAVYASPWSFDLAVCPDGWPESAKWPPTTFVPSTTTTAPARARASQERARRRRATPNSTSIRDDGIGGADS